MHDIDEVAYDNAYVYENIKKGQKKAERRYKILFFVKWFGLGLLVGAVITVLTSCGSAPAEDTRPAQTIEETVTEEPAPAEGELTNNILIVNKRGITLYGGAWVTEQEYASYINAYKEALGNVNVYSMVLPTSSSFYLPENYQNLAQSEKADFDKIDAALSNVLSVDAYSSLLYHKDEPIYSRTDHHWQPLGAYYAAEKFALTAGVPFADLSHYETITLPGYMGTLYMYTQSATLLNNPEDFVYYKPKTNVTVTQYDTHFQNPVAANLLLDPFRL